MKMNIRFVVAASLAIAGLWGLTSCEGLTREEALVAIEEAALTSEAANVAGGSIEITTSFTLGGALEEVAEEIRSFIASQMPCAEITIEGTRLTVDYGALDGSCQYRGQTFSGTHVIELVSVNEDNVLVTHEWQNFSNGRMSITGTAEVAWENGYADREIYHELRWTRLSDGRFGEDEGYRYQHALNGDWAQGVVINGARTWKGESGGWNLEIEEVEARWIDPVPQSGVYNLTRTADARTATITFERIDDDTIAVLYSSGRYDTAFTVNRSGEISD